MAGYVSTLLCVPNTAFLPPEAASCITLSVTLPSIRLHLDEWERDGQGEAGSCICCSVLSLGFDYNEYRTLRLEHIGCFWHFVICWVKVLMPDRPQEWVGQNLTAVAFFVGWWWLVQHYNPLYHFSSPDPGLSLNMYWPPWLKCHSFPSCPPSVGYTSKLLYLLRPWQAPNYS